MSQKGMRYDAATGTVIYRSKTHPAAEAAQASEDIVRREP